MRRNETRSLSLIYGFPVNSGTKKFLDDLHSKGLPLAGKRIEQSRAANLVGKLNNCALGASMRRDFSD